MLQLQEIFLNQFNLCRVGLKKPIKNNHDKFPNLFQHHTEDKGNCNSTEIEKKEKNRKT